MRGTCHEPTASREHTQHRSEPPAQLLERTDPPGPVKSPARGGYAASANLLEHAGVLSGISNLERSAYRIELDSLPHPATGRKRACSPVVHERSRHAELVYTHTHANRRSARFCGKLIALFYCHDLLQS